MLSDRYEIGTDDRFETSFPIELDRRVSHVFESGKSRILMIDHHSSIPRLCL